MVPTTSSVPYLRGDITGVCGDRQLADLVSGGNPLVELCRSRVARKPEGFAVGRITRAAVVLLLAGINDGDAI